MKKLKFLREKTFKEEKSWNIVVSPTQTSLDINDASGFGNTSISLLKTPKQLLSRFSTTKVILCVPNKNKFEVFWPKESKLQVQLIYKRLRLFLQKRKKKRRKKRKKIRKKK